MNAADPFVELARVLRELPSACSDACGCTRGAALLKTTFPFGGAVAVNRELLDELLDAGLLDLAGELVGRHDRHDRGAQLTALFAIMDWAFWMRDDARYRGSPHMGRLGALALPIVEAYEARSDELFAHDQLVDDSLGPVIVLVLAWLGNPPYAPRRGEAISDAAIRMMVAVYMSSSVVGKEAFRTFARIGGGRAGAHMGGVAAAGAVRGGPGDARQHHRLCRHRPTGGSVRAGGRRKGERAGAGGESVDAALLHRAALVAGSGGGDGDTRVRASTRRAAQGVGIGPRAARR